MKLSITKIPQGKNYAYKIGTHIRLLELNYFSTFTKLIEYFNLVDKCDKTTDDLFILNIPYRLERIHKRWQLTEYVIKDYAFIDDDDDDDDDYNDKPILVYHIESIDGKSNLIVPHDCVEPIKDYNSAWMIE